MIAMEIEIVASFPDRKHMEQAMESIRAQGAIDVRPCGGFAASAAAGSASDSPFHPRPAIRVLMEKSRFRQAEDTIRRHQGTLHSSPVPSTVFVQDLR